MTARQEEAMSEPTPLERYGVTWTGEKGTPLHAPMPDGYWTPWHVASQQVAALTAQLAEAQRETDRHQRAAEALLSEQAEVKAALGLLGGGVGRTLAEEIKHQLTAAQAEATALREALAKVRAHTSYQPQETPPLDLLKGLLASIERITESALGGQPPTESETCR